MRKIFSLTILFSLLASHVLAQSEKIDKKYIKPQIIMPQEDIEFEDYVRREPQIYDPYEKVNRKIYTFNDYFDRYFFEHVARAYKGGVPSPVRRGIRNFVTNLGLPMSAINSFAQGKVDNGLATISNFLINSTVGVLGIFNVAGEKGIIYRGEDFGQTMGHYGVNSGPYLVVPFLGPSSSRDFGGWVFDKGISPTGFNVLDIGNKENFIQSEYRLGINSLTAIDIRASLLEIVDDVRRESFDPYATVRSAYLQKRISEIQY